MSKAKYAVAAVGTAAVLFAPAGIPMTVGTLQGQAIHRRERDYFGMFIPAEAKKVVVPVANVSTVPAAAPLAVDETFEWSDPFSDFVDPRPTKQVSGSARQVDPFEALADLWRDADGEAWFD